MTDSNNTLVNLLATTGAAGIRLWPQDGSIHYRSPEPLSQNLRALVVAHKPALLARLAVWDAQEATRLEFEADGLVESLCVSGSDPAIREAASRCVEAHHREDMAGVRAGCALVEDRARRMAKAFKEAA